MEQLHSDQNTNVGSVFDPLVTVGISTQVTCVSNCIILAFLDDALVKQQQNPRNQFRPAYNKLLTPP
jgi:hypothetical protein